MSATAATPCATYTPTSTTVSKTFSTTSATPSTILPAVSTRSKTPLMHWVVVGASRSNPATPPTMLPTGPKMPPIAIPEETEEYADVQSAAVLTTSPSGVPLKTSSITGVKTSITDKTELKLSTASPKADAPYLKESLSMTSWMTETEVSRAGPHPTASSMIDSPVLNAAVFTFSQILAPSGFTMPLPLMKPNNWSSPTGISLAAVPEGKTVDSKIDSQRSTPPIMLLAKFPQYPWVESMVAATVENPSQVTDAEPTDWCSRRRRLKCRCKRFLDDKACWVHASRRISASGDSWPRSESMSMISSVLTWPSLSVSHPTPLSIFAVKLSAPSLMARISAWAWSN
mmetsp:Transcript_3385/g.5772  ORF Transcript_3385/g.5772 Transcript_3385/m.5772 type:complete len:343 (+) Transcript_3385:1683-2711(+)